MAKNICSEIKRVFRETAQNNYRSLRFSLNINKNFSKQLINNTHKLKGFWNLYPYAIQDLTKECLEKSYSGNKAFEHISANYKDQAEKLREEFIRENQPEYIFTKSKN